MSYSHFTSFVFLLTNLVSPHFAATAVTDSRLQIQDYDNKVCKNEPTCSLTTTIPNLEPKKLTFPWRDCMCDSDCSEYDDCCQDSQFYKEPKHNLPSKTYYCSPQTKIYMVVSCLPDFADEQIKANCAKAFKPLESENLDLVVPVTNVAKNITYANRYCASCNEDENFIQWSHASRCGEPTKQALERRRLEVRKESSPVLSDKHSTSAPTPTPASTPTPMPTPKPNHNRLNINFHLNPGNGGFNKTISIPTFGNLGTKLANKTIGSETGLFGVKTTARRKRHSDLGSINYNLYNAKELNEILKVAKYDPSVKELVAEYNNKTLICQMGYKMPETINKAVRHCIPDLISQCPNDKEANKVCQSYTRIVHNTITKKSYRNVDCAICNGVNPKNTNTKLIGCQMETRGGGGASTIFLKNAETSTGVGCVESEVISCKSR